MTVLYVYYLMLFNSIKPDEVVKPIPGESKKVERDRNRGIERDRTFSIFSK